MYERRLPINEADEKQSMSYNELKKKQSKVKHQEKNRNLLKSLGVIFNGREEILNPFKGSIFLMKPMDDDALEETSLNPSKTAIRKQTVKGNNTLTSKHILYR